MSAALANMGAGFADPVHGAQQTFRVLLRAMSEPGRLHALHDAATDGLAPDDAGMGPPTGIAMAATLLTLLDADTPVHLAGALGNDDARAWLRFHTGARAVATAAGMTIALARDVDAASWNALDLGSDEAPQTGATLIVEVDALSDQPIAGALALTLRGAGIETSRNLAVAGLSAAFWQWRIALQADLPRGVDLVLVCGTQLAAIPRSTRIEREA
ncbi:phosphonate C-P lyase system protein PhnH [Scleromatobacter humisilvae]|uniref:Phosphonate C-P lyase system protein PhnH n=1 Tax=Scleromatobacter humisilvae TaxID=2897159 RepID=A0A9X2C0T0_9BURK|nr:phosphonate C-P lyase system protein PhnH [Scleromatobacter humisilvae]MCK9686761.1 phosphonate C-P lyase system protein PhnH [Scleromatobacter humisilvae]